MQLVEFKEMPTFMHLFIPGKSCYNAFCLVPCCIYSKFDGFSPVVHICPVCNGQMWSEMDFEEIPGYCCPVEGDTWSCPLTPSQFF